MRVESPSRSQRVLGPSLAPLTRLLPLRAGCTKRMVTTPAGGADRREDRRTWGHALPCYTVRMTDRDDTGRTIERTVTVDAVNTAVARWKALSLHGSDAAEVVSVHNDGWGVAASGPLRRILVNGEPSAVLMDDTHVYGGHSLLGL